MHCLREGNVDCPGPPTGCAVQRIREHSGEWPHAIDALDCDSACCSCTGRIEHLDAEIECADVVETREAVERTAQSPHRNKIIAINNPKFRTTRK